MSIRHALWSLCVCVTTTGLLFGGCVQHAPSADSEVCTSSQDCGEHATCSLYKDGLTYCVDLPDEFEGSESDVSSANGMGMPTRGATTARDPAMEDTHQGSDVGNLCQRACERINTCSLYICSEPAIHLETCVAHCEEQGVLSAAPIIGRACDELNASICEAGDFPACNCEADTVAWCLQNCTDDADCPTNQICAQLDPQAMPQCLDADGQAPDSTPQCGLGNSCDEGHRCYRLTKAGDGRLSCVAACEADADCEGDQTCEGGICVVGGFDTSGEPIVPKDAQPCDVHGECPEGQWCVETQ